MVFFLYQSYGVVTFLSDFLSIHHTFISIDMYQESIFVQNQWQCGNGVFHMLTNRNKLIEELMGHIRMNIKPSFWPFHKGIQTKKINNIISTYQNVITLKFTYKSTWPAGFYSSLPFHLGNLHWPASLTLISFLMCVCV